MADILTESGWQSQIRKLIGVKSSTMSDSDLSGDLFLGMAEGRIEKILPTWQTILNGSNAAEKMALKNATKAYVGYLVVNSPGYEQEHTSASIRVSDLSVERFKESNQDKKARLLALVYQELGRIAAYVANTAKDLTLIVVGSETYTDSVGNNIAQGYRTITD